MKNIISEIILLDKPVSSVNNTGHPWDLVTNISAIFNDIPSSFKNFEHVIINDDNGPVIIGKNVIIEPFTILNGPLFIGEDCLIKSHSKIANSIINHHCKISGEIHFSIFQPYSNKAHHGFLGHSFVGSWVNLGAGTTTSNQKNNYSNISVKWNGELINIGSIFFGSVIGDHVKTAIGTNLNTGTVIGMGSNIVSQSFPPRYIPPFSLYYKGKITKEELGITDEDKFNQLKEFILAKKD